MKNPNSTISKIRAALKARWSAEDFPGAKPRFQLSHFGKDVVVFGVLPIAAIIFFKSCETAFSGQTNNKNFRTISTGSNDLQESYSQIIEFGRRVSGGTIGTAKRAPGTLVKVRLLNSVETYSSAPVHAQIVDSGLGKNLLGATIIGDATSETNFERIEMNFKFVRPPRSPGVAFPITARALSLDGTLGLTGKKKEGFFARAAFGTSSSATQDGLSNIDGNDLKSFIARALTTGIAQEFGNESQVARNRAQVLTLSPNSEFYVELTDYFPSSK